MGSRIINFVMIFVAVCQLATANVGDPPQKATQRGPIQLKKIVYGDFYVSSRCSKGCEVKSSQSAVEPIDCYPNIGNYDLSSCKHGWVANWDSLDLGKSANQTTCYPSPPSNVESDFCPYCICITDDISYSIKVQENHRMVATFSLNAVESNIDDNMIVTGLRFDVEHSVIHFQIQQSKLLSNGTIDNLSTRTDHSFPESRFDESGGDKSVLDLDDEDFFTIQYNARALFLDEIFVPDDYIVTGVKFERLAQSDRMSGLKIKVKGTKFDSSYRLIKDTDRWFKAPGYIQTDPSYSRPRSEIALSRSTVPGLASNNVDIGDTNRLILFRSTDISQDFSPHIIPYFSGDSAESSGILRGVGISYKGQRGFGGYITAKVFTR